MSPLWRDRIQIVVSPQQISLTRYVRGWTSHTADKRVAPCRPAQPGETSWHNAATALESAITVFGRRAIDVHVVLSNHFVRYALVPDSDQIRTNTELQALVRHRFARTYGTTDRWMLRVSDRDSTGGRVASAVDTDLIVSLDAIFASTLLKCCSIQPYLMTAFNQWRDRINADAWFVLVEHGRLCLAHINRGQWQSIKTIKIGEDWLAALNSLLARERLIAGLDNVAFAAMPVLVVPPEDSEVTLAQEKEHSIQILRPAAAPKPAAETIDVPLAAAVKG